MLEAVARKMGKMSIVGRGESRVGVAAFHVVSRPSIVADAHEDS